MRWAYVGLDECRRTLAFFRSSALQPGLLSHVSLAPDGPYLTRTDPPKNCRLIIDR